MISPTAIAARSARLYPAYLRAWLRGEPFFPQALPVGKLPADYHELQAAVQKLLASAKHERRPGYSVELRTTQTRAFGSQSLPERVLIETERDLLALAGKSEEFAAFQSDVQLIRAQLPQLETWLADNSGRVIEQHGVWPELLRVCAYFLAHPRPGCYARELPIDVHTKFIEQHAGILRRLLDALLPPETISAAETDFTRRFGLRYDEPLIRMRLLDPALQAQLNLPFDDLSAPVSQWAALPLHGTRCLIVENKMTFLTLPPLPGTLALFGGGFRVELLARLPWLHTCTIVYWGDLDAQGFQILAQLRASFPQTVSLMMDAATFETFRAFAVPGTPCPVAVLPQLTAEEQVLFSYLAQYNLRLEQERISYVYTRAALATKMLV